MDLGWFQAARVGCYRYSIRFDTSSTLICLTAVRFDTISKLFRFYFGEFQVPVVYTQRRGKIQGCNEAPSERMGKIQNMKIVQQLCPEEVWGPKLCIKVGHWCGAEGRTQSPHFSCAIWAPRPPPDTIVVQISFFVFGRLFHSLSGGQPRYKSRVDPGLKHLACAGAPGTRPGHVEAFLSARQPYVTQ